MSDWQLAGTYLEACNCEAVCPCRRIGGRAGGRSGGEVGGDRLATLLADIIYSLLNPRIRLATEP